MSELLHSGDAYRFTRSMIRIEKGEREIDGNGGCSWYKWDLWYKIKM